MYRILQKVRYEFTLPRAAKLECRKDVKGLPSTDPGLDALIDEGVAWLCRAQDYSASSDGGVARDYSLVQGWATSYPETTGYIIPTVLKYAKIRGTEEELKKRAQNMLDWLSSIQFEDGGFQGGRIDSEPVVPVTFNTGQILLGLAAGAADISDRYKDAMIRAGDWLVATQDKDGCWRKHDTPFAASGEKAYETHVSWGLFEAERIVSGRGYAEAGLKQVRWALKNQHDNGWIDNCCLTDPLRPLTHTLGYGLRGILEAFRLSNEQSFLSAARRTADGLLTALSEDGHLPGRLTSDWQPAVDWVCLTGSAQIGESWLILYQVTGEPSYRDAGFRINQFVRRTMSVDGPPEIRGGIKGSFPINGSYGSFEYLSWATKFAIDSNLLERQIRNKEVNK